jgi:peroxiredoxin
VNVLPLVSCPTKCLTRGDKSPPFELVDPVKGVLRSSELLQAGPVLLTFYRGAWCGCCVADIRDLIATLPSLESESVSTIGVFYGLDAEANARIRTTYRLNFLIVDDPDGRTAQAFGIRRTMAEIAEIENEFSPELLALQGGQPWILPMQARYLIGRDGTIAYSEIVTNYNDRSSAACVLSLLLALR